MRASAAPISPLDVSATTAALMTHWKWHKLSNFSAYVRADPRLCKQTVHGALGEHRAMAVAGPATLPAPTLPDPYL